MTDLININKFLNNAIGFEDIFNRFSLLNHYNTGFPYYNIKKNAKADQYTLEMSLSGYKKSDINWGLSIPASKYLDINLFN